MKRAVIYIVILSVLLARYITLDNTMLWYDEAFTANLAMIDINKLIVATANDVHPPLYYLIEKGMCAIDCSEMGLRFPSFLFFIASLLMVYLIFRDDENLWITLLFTATSALALRYASEARMYTLLMFLYLLGFYAIKNRKFVLLSVSITLLLYTHNYGIIYSLVLFVVAMLEEIKRPVIAYPWDSKDTEANFVKLLTTFSVPGVLYMPWLYVLVKQLHFVHGTHWLRLSLGGILLTLQELFIPLDFYSDVKFAFTIIAFIVLFVSLRYLRQSKMVIVTILPILIAVVISFYQPVLLFRALLPVMPFLYYSIGRMVVENIRKRKFIYPALFIALHIITCINVLTVDERDKNVRDIIPLLSSQQANVILHTNVESAILSRYYLPHATHYILDTGCVEQNIGSLSKGTENALGLNRKNDGQLYIYAIGPFTTSCEYNFAKSYKQEYQRVYTQRVDLGELEVYALH